MTRAGGREAKKRKASQETKHNSDRLGDTSGEGGESARRDLPFLPSAGSCPP